MATKRPLRPCKRVGCPNLVRPPETYCSEHIQQEQKYQRYYDRHIRDQRAKAFYRSKEWLALREFVLVRDNYLCVLCLRSKQITRAVAVDHIIPISEDWSRRLDPTNCRSLCLACHNRVRPKQA